MFKTQIADIDIKLSLSDFENEMKNAVMNLSEPMDLNITSVETRRGKKMYKIEFENQHCGKFTIVAECDPNSGDMMFRPLILQSVNNSFYEMKYTSMDNAGSDYDPSDAFVRCLHNIAIRHKGRLAYITQDGQPQIIGDGKQKTARSIALIDDNGNVYSCAGSKKVSGDKEDSSFTVNVPIGDWLREHPDIQRTIAAMPLDQKMNYIGKWLIQARINEEVESDEFMDIFRQAGIFGFSEPSVLHIYKLIM